MLILRNTDRVPCKIGKITLWVSPITWAEKTNLFKMVSLKGGQEKTDETGMLIETLRLSIKKVDGLSHYKFSDGSKASLEFDDNGRLTTESLELLIRLLGPVPVSRISSAILTDALNDDIEGFEIDYSKVEDTSKKKSSSVNQ